MEKMIKNDTIDTRSRTQQSVYSLRDHDSFNAYRLWVIKNN